MNKKNVATHERPFEMMALALVLFLVEGYIWLQFFVMNYSLIYVFAAHLFLSLCCATLIPYYRRRHVDLRMIWLIVTAVAFLGPFGAGIGLMVVPLMFLFHRIAPPVHALLDEILPPLHVDRSKKIVERLMYNLDSYDPNRMPLAFQDVMAFGSNHQKQVAIQRMLKNFRPEFTTSLMHAINDENRAVRILAATAIVRLEKQYNDAFEVVQEEMKLHPHSPDVLLNFARHCDGQSRLKFVDAIRVRKLRQMALDVYERYLTVAHGHEKIYIAMARLYCLEDRPHDAVKLLEPFIERHVHILDEVIHWYMTALFAAKEYSRLRDFAKMEIVITGESIHHDEIVDNFLMWRQARSLNEAVEVSV